VIGLSRCAEKRGRLTDLGVQQVFDPAIEGLGQSIRMTTGGFGVDMVLDLLGAGALDLNLSVLREQGRIVLIGLLGGAKAELDLGRLISRRLTLTGSVLRSRPLEEKIALVQRFAARMLPLFASGSLRPVIDRCYPWTEVAEAHALMERNANFGKIVLTVE
jgi:NADPH:quinone reductase-like Zn-dependent oxidoreductase